MYWSLNAKGALCILAVFEILQVHATVRLYVRTFFVVFFHVFIFFYYYNIRSHMMHMLASCVSIWHPRLTCLSCIDTLDGLYVEHRPHTFYSVYLSYYNHSMCIACLPVHVSVVCSCTCNANPIVIFLSCAPPLHDDTNHHIHVVR